MSGTWEGLGGPVHMNRPDFRGIDPSLEDCCRRELESTARKKVLLESLSRHDVTVAAERRRRNLLPSLFFEGSGGDGCRCCYDPHRDGGNDYFALREARSERMRVRMRQQQQEEEQQQREQEEQQQREQQQQMQEEGNDKGQKEEEHEQEPNDIETKNKFCSDGEEDRDVDDYEGDGDGDEFDYLLDEDFVPAGKGSNDDEGARLIHELEERRRAELEWDLLTRQTAVQHGYGVHRQMHPGRVLKAAGLRAGPMDSGAAAAAPPPRAVVLHLFAPNSTVSASLDLHLEELAMTYRGTKFLRSDGRATMLMDVDHAASKAFPFPRLKYDNTFPTLVAIRDGTVISISSNKLQGLTASVEKEDEIIAHLVRDWLQRAGVLIETLPRFEDLCRIRPEEQALLDDMTKTTSKGNIKSNSKAAEEEEEKWYRYDCGIPTCRKSFPHEHIGIQTKEQDGLFVPRSDVTLSSS